MSDEIDFHIGKRMRRRRRLLGLTQQQLADSCGVRFQQIQKYECGANRVSAARLWRIAGALETPVSYFYEGLAASASAMATSKLEPTVNVLRAHPGLGDRARRPMLDVTRHLGRDNDAA